MTIMHALAARTAASRHDGSILELLVLPQSRRDAITNLCRRLGMSPGDTWRCVDLALRCARQYLRQPIAIGTVVERIDGRGGRQIVVGSKPAGFREELLRPRRAVAPGRDAFTGWDEALVWTVDASAGRPGISQSPLSEWREIAKEA